MSPGVVLLAEGPHVGLGHLSRSSAVAVALRGMEIEPLCLVNGAGTTERYGVVWSPVEQAPAEAKEAGDVLLLDSYEVSPAQAVAAFAPRSLVVFGDHGESPEEADLVLGGLEYACVGPEFWEAPPRNIDTEVRRVVVSTGRGETIGVGAGLAARLRSELPGAQVALVAPADPGLPEGVEQLGTPDSLFAPLRSADLAVTAGGQTMLEATAVGTPCIAISLAENQRRQIERLVAAGAVREAGGPEPEQVATAAGELARDVDARRRMSRAGQQAVDGRGAQRVAGEVRRLAGG